MIVVCPPPGSRTGLVPTARARAPSSRSARAASARMESRLRRSTA